MIPGSVEAVREGGAPGTAVFLNRGKATARPGTTPGMSRWRQRLFLATSQITADAAEYLRLPRERTVIMGSRIGL